MFALSRAAYGFGAPREAKGPSAPTIGHLYRNTHYGFELVVPRGWTATTTNFAPFFMADYQVFLTINSARPNLTIRDQPRYVHGRVAGYECSPQTIFQQMQPGEVYLDIGYFAFLGGPRMKRDSVHRNLHRLLATNQLSTASVTGLSSLGLTFFKRGHSWFIELYMKRPISVANRRKARAMLASFRFLDAPVGNTAWAESLAWDHLPPWLQVPAHLPRWEVMDWPNAGTPATGFEAILKRRIAQIRREFGLGGLGGNQARQQVVVKRLGAGYLVRFAIADLGSREYFVGSNGKVTQRTNLTTEFLFGLALVMVVILLGFGIGWWRRVHPLDGNSPD